MAWLVMAIQILCPCEVFHMTRRGVGFKISRFGGLFEYDTFNGFIMD